MDAATIQIVAALICDDSGRVLLVRKRGTSAFMQPGGKRDAGEDDVTALSREIADELGCGVVPNSIRPLGEFNSLAANEPSAALTHAQESTRLFREVGDQREAAQGHETRSLSNASTTLDTQAA